MRIIVDNIKSKAVTGGSDNLLDVDVMEELRKYMRIRPKGYSFSPKYRDRHWDGYKYFITNSGVFATGFLPMVVSFLEELGVEVEIEDNRKNLPKLRDDIDNYIGRINGVDWKADGKYFYQVEAVRSINNHINLAGNEYYFPRGILDCATNAGKNSISALIYRNLEEPVDTVFMVSNRTIYKQAVEFFSEALGEEVGEVRSGKCKPKRFTVCMVKTLLNRAKDSLNIRKWLSNVGLLIVDESDEAGATEYSKVIRYIGAGMRVFVSGTPLESSNSSNMIAIGLSGKILYKITNRELIGLGVSQNPIVRMVLNNSGKLPLPNYEAEKYQFIHHSEERARLIAEIVEKHIDEQILISFTEIEHGYFMYEYLMKHVSADIGIVHGESPDREDIIEDFKTGRISILFASQILQKGANIKNIRVLILAHGGKSTKIIKQYTGRALRHDGENDEVFIYDFYDVGKYIGKHSRDRIRIYKKEGFDVEEMYKSKRNKPVL